MSVTIKSFCVRPGGHVVALLAGGSLVEQVPRQNNPSGQFHCDWHEVPTDGLTGRVTQVAARYDGSLLALTASGALFEQFRDHTDRPGRYRWRVIDGPAEAL